MGPSPENDAAAAAPQRLGMEVERGLRRVLVNTGASVIGCNRDLLVDWAVNVPPLWSEKDLTGCAFHEFLPAEAADGLASAGRRVLTTRKTQRLDISVPRHDGAQWFTVWVDPDVSDADIHGVVSTVMDITEQRRREQTLRTLLREVAHRSKNLLAIIQSIATQTGRHSGTIEGFLARFRGRLQSLASTQDLVTSSNWRGADLHELIRGQVRRYTADPQRSLRLVGPSVYLDPNAALHVGLALHELAVNSISYGALARPDGYVTVGARPVDGPEGHALEFTWSETISIGDQALGQRRFGSVALERIVPASLDGRASLDISSERLEYRLTIPAGHYEE